MQGGVTPEEGCCMCAPVLRVFVASEGRVGGGPQEGSEAGDYFHEEKNRKAPELTNCINRFPFASPCRAPPLPHPSPAAF